MFDTWQSDPDFESPVGVFIFERKAHCEVDCLPVSTLKCRTLPKLSLSDLSITDHKGRQIIYSKLRARLLSALICFLCLAGANHSAAMVAQVVQQTLPTLTTAKAAHDLSLEEAARSYPVHLKAVVTYYGALINPQRPALFVHDATGGVYVVLSAPVTFNLPAGTLIEINGVSADGDFAPIVAHATARFLRRSEVPSQAPVASLSQMLTGRFDGQWVEVEGVVRSVTEFGPDIMLALATSEGILSTNTMREPGADYSHLIDALVRIHGDACPLYNRHGQLTGAHLLFPGLAQLKIVKPAIGDPFSLPLLPIDRLMRASPDIAFGRRVHVRGAVTLQWTGRSLCIQDGSKALCVQTTQTAPLVQGEVVDVAGFPAVGDFRPTLTDAIFRSTGHSQIVKMPTVTAEKALEGDEDSSLVQIEGKLIGKDRGSNSTLMLSAGKYLFPIILPEPSSDQGTPRAVAPNWQVGSILRVTGICSVSRTSGTESLREGFSVPASFRILVQSSKDVMILKKPSWWTAVHLLPLLAFILAGTLCVLLWAMLLRRRLTEQTEVISNQNVKLTSLSFQDGLTRLANRRKFDQTLGVEISAAARTSTPLSLLMMDVDHFKALNDISGHQRGDACLTEVASALGSASLRSSDLIARYGGEEFALIMPLCDEKGAFAIAERMRLAVLALGIPHPASPTGNHISISIGSATIMPDSGTTSASLIAIADQALYQSKQNGRNRTTCAVTPVFAR